MKAVYKKTVVEQISALRGEAFSRRQTIEKIVLTRKEAYQLVDETAPLSPFITGPSDLELWLNGSGVYAPVAQPRIQVCGIDIEVEGA